MTDPDPDPDPDPNPDPDPDSVSRCILLKSVVESDDLGTLYFASYNSEHLHVEKGMCRGCLLPRKVGVKIILAKPRANSGMAGRRYGRSRV